MISCPSAEHELFQGAGPKAARGHPDEVLLHRSLLRNAGGSTAPLDHRRDEATVCACAALASPRRFRGRAPQGEGPPSSGICGWERPQ